IYFLLVYHMLHHMELSGDFKSVLFIEQSCCGLFACPHKPGAMQPFCSHLVETVVKKDFPQSFSLLVWVYTKGTKPVRYSFISAIHTKAYNSLFKTGNQHSFHRQILKNAFPDSSPPVRIEEIICKLNHFRQITCLHRPECI